MTVPDAEAKRYVESWFWNLTTLAQASGLSEQDALILMEAGCAPGVVYGRDPNGAWWSALAAARGDVQAKPPATGQYWYSPGATWWLRRALIQLRVGATPDQAAQHNRQAFTAEFTERLGSIEGAPLAYPAGFDADGHMVTDNLANLAASEWADWINGAYGVCLRDFSASTCIRKSSLAALLKVHFAGRLCEPWSDERVVAAAQELSALLTPFAPWERASGTPGQTIDVALKRLNLGGDHPYPYPQPAAAI
jgi:hypothetical protein